MYVLFLFSFFLFCFGSFVFFFFSSSSTFFFFFFGGEGVGPSTKHYYYYIQHSFNMYNVSTLRCRLTKRIMLSLDTARPCVVMCFTLMDEH